MVNGGTQARVAEFYWVSCFLVDAKDVSSQLETVHHLNTRHSLSIYWVLSHHEGYVTITKLGSILHRDREFSFEFYVLIFNFFV